MKNKKEEIDILIKEALTNEEAKFYDALEEQNLLKKFTGVFKGKMGWLVIIMHIVNFLMLGLLIYCGIQFFNTTMVSELIKWSLGIFLCILFMSMIKLYVWMQMDKNDVLRALKRLELQMVALMGK